MAAPVMGYDAIAVVEEEQHLRVPIIGRQRPAVAENDWLTGAPILEINLRSVFSRDRIHNRFIALIGLVPPLISVIKQCEISKEIGRTFFNKSSFDALT